MTSSDEDVNILTTWFCLIILISSGSGYSGFTSIEIDDPTTLALFSPVTFSKEDNYYDFQGLLL